MAVPRRSLTLLRRLARHNGGIVDQTVRDITTGWLQAWTDLSPAWQAAITALLDRYAATGAWPAPWQVSRIEAIARAAEQTERSLTRLTADGAALTSDAAARISDATLAAEPSVIASQTPGLAADEIAVPTSRAGSAPDARKARIGSLFRPISASVLAAITWEFTHPPDAGRRPASGMLDRVRVGFDTGQIRAATIARTEPIDAYRTAAQLVHAANPRTVTGWAWLSQLDLRACVSCWGMHGSTHELDEPGPHSHPSCRCQRLPLVGDNSLATAEARFRRLSRREQLAILGPARFELLHAGQITWADLVTQRTTSGWRDSSIPRPVADLKRMAGVRSP